jgi:predicted nucleic acid-binding protein
MATIEIDAMPDSERRERVQLLLPPDKFLLRLDEAIFARGRHLQALGFKRADAVHLAAAEAQGADVLLSCDDRFRATARRHRKQLKVRVATPLEWFTEVSHDQDS